MKLEEVIKKPLSKEEIAKLSRFAFWAHLGAEYKGASDCGSCSSFCSSGACTTCTGAMDMGYLQVQKYEEIKKYD